MAMKLIGRIISLPFGIVLLALLLLTLVWMQVNRTFLNPAYYKEELRKADIYNFVTNDLLTSALDEARELPPSEGMDENLLVTTGLETAQILDSVNDAIPPEWVQAQVEESLDEFGQYLVGERDTFTLTINPGERVEQVLDELQELIHEADAYELIYSQQIDPKLEELASSDLPLGIDVTGDQLKASFRKIVPPDWVETQVDNAIDEVTPYLAGKEDSFLVTVPLSDRVEAALEETKIILAQSDAYDIVYRQAVEPTLVESLGDFVDLPLGIRIAREEVLDALRRVAPPEWVQEQAEAIIDDSTPYIGGRVETFATEIDLTESKERAAVEISALVEARTNEVLARIPSCATIEEFFASGGAQPGSLALPRCVPPGTDPQQILAMLGIDLDDLVARSIVSNIPNTITFSEFQIRSALTQTGAVGTLEQIDHVRKLFKEGFTYDQNDLARDFAEMSDTTEADAAERIAEFRDWLENGFTYTEVDFQADLAEADDPETAQSFNDARNILKSAKTWGTFLLFFMVLLLLAIIGFLGGGSRWSMRVAWAGAFLMVTSAITFIVFLPVYSALASPRIEQARADMLADIRAGGGDFVGTAELAAGKGFDMAVSMADGLAFRSFLLTLLGLALFLGAFLGLSVRQGVSLPPREVAGGKGPR